MNYSVVIVAAGNSTRFGGNSSKMLYEFPDGQKVIEKTISIFRSDENCRQIIIACNKEVLEYFKGKPTSGKISFCYGGDSRQESVYHGLMAVCQDYVLVHDGARCFTNAEDIRKLADALSENQGAILVRKETDTIKLLDNGRITTIDRDKLFRAQTPQGFPTQLLIDCSRKALEDSFTATDDAQIIEKYSDCAIELIISSNNNTKITTIEDVKGEN